MIPKDWNFVFNNFEIQKLSNFSDNGYQNNMFVSSKSINTDDTALLQSEKNFVLSLYFKTQFWFKIFHTTNIVSTTFFVRRHWFIYIQRQDFLCTSGLFCDRHIFIMYYVSNKCGSMYFICSSMYVFSTESNHIREGLSINWS